MLVSNASSVLVRPNNTSAYAVNNLIANAVAAGSVVLPSFNVQAGGFNAQGACPRVRLFTNVTVGWGGVILRVRLWSAPPVYTNGDGGAYAVASGSQNRFTYSGFDVTLSQLADGAVGEAVPNVGTAVYVGGPSSVYWDLMVVSGTPTPIANQQFILQPEVIG